MGDRDSKKPTIALPDGPEEERDAALSRLASGLESTKARTEARRPRTLLERAIAMQARADAKASSDAP